MTKGIRIAALLLSALCAVPAGAQFRPDELKAAQEDPGRFTLDRSTVRIVRVGPAPKPDAPRLRVGALPSLDDILNTALKLWKIIEANKPVADVKTQFAAALPKGVDSARELAGWHAPEGTVYEVMAENVYGQTVVEIRYQVLRTYGGSFQGKGRYLTAVTVEPLLVDVAWGYRLSLDASVPDSSVVNVGTHEDPVAGMMVRLGWSIVTPVQDSRGAYDYFVQGDGAFREIGGPVTRPGLKRAKETAAALSRRKVRFD